MKAFKFYVILILLSAKLFSQLGPGYMGKRVTAGYGFYFSPAFFGSTAQNESIFGDDGSAETGSFVFNATHEGSLEFAFSNKWSVGFSVRYFKTTYDNAANFGFNNYNFSYSFNDLKPNGYYNITGLTYSLYFKHFAKRFVAPWGRYIMFGPVINTSIAEYDPGIMNAKARTSNSYSEQMNFGPQEQSFTGFNLMFGMGRSRIVANRIILEYGFTTYAISVLSIFTDYLDIGFGNRASYNLSSSNYIENTHGRRVRGVNRCNAFIKVGLLLF